jgi:hypothetical protein
MKVVVKVLTESAGAVLLPDGKEMLTDDDSLSKALEADETGTEVMPEETPDETADDAPDDMGTSVTPDEIPEETPEETGASVIVDETADEAPEGVSVIDEMTELAPEAPDDATLVGPAEDSVVEPTVVGPSTEVEMPVTEIEAMLLGIVVGTTVVTGGRLEGRSVKLDNVIGGKLEGKSGSEILGTEIGIGIDIEIIGSVVVTGGSLVPVALVTTG